MVSMVYSRHLSYSIIFIRACGTKYKVTVVTSVRPVDLLNRAELQGDMLVALRGGMWKSVALEESLPSDVTEFQVLRGLAACTLCARSLTLFYFPCF